MKRRDSKPKSDFVAARTLLPIDKLSLFAKEYKARLRAPVEFLFSRMGGSHRFRFWDSRITSFDAWDSVNSASDLYFSSDQAFQLNALDHWLKMLATARHSSEVSVDYLPSRRKERGTFVGGSLGIHFNLPGMRFHETPPCYSLHYRMAESSPQAMCGLAHKILEAWNEDDRWRFVETNASGANGFDIETCDNRTQLRRWEYDTPAGWRFPDQVSVEPWESFDSASRCFREALKLWPGEIEKITTRVFVAPHDYAAIRADILPWKQTWNYEFSGFYRPRFDPLARPKKMPEDRTYRYPVLLLQRHNLAPLKLQVDVVHATDRSFLEFQSSQGKDKLLPLLRLANMKYEFWDGPFEDRWGQEGTSQNEESLAKAMLDESRAAWPRESDLERAALAAYSMIGLDIAADQIGLVKRYGEKPESLHYSILVGAGRIPLPCRVYANEFHLRPEERIGVRYLIDGSVAIQKKTMQVVSRLLIIEPKKILKVATIESDPSQELLAAALLETARRFEPLIID